MYRSKKFHIKRWKFCSERMERIFNSVHFYSLEILPSFLPSRSKGEERSRSSESSRGTNSHRGYVAGFTSMRTYSRDAKT